MAEATKEDAQLVVQLATLGTQMAHPRARGWIWSDKFSSDPGEFFEKYPPGSDEFDYVGGVSAWYETVGTLWKRGLLNEELVFDWLYVAGIWNRLKPILLAMREESKTDRLWENFEAMAEAQVGALSGS
jgi:hypothetical protein